MTIKGPPPKENPRHRIKPPHEWTEVVNVPFVATSGPGSKPLTEDWPKRTRVFWNIVRRMPHAKLWGAEEWEYALETCEIHRQWWKKPWDMRLAGELRRRQTQMGFGWDNRRTIRIRYIDPPTPVEDSEEERGENVVDIENRFQAI